MPLAGYGVLRGKVIDVLPFVKIGNHYHIEVSAVGQSYRIAVDVYSTYKGSVKATGEDNPGVWDIDRLLLFYLSEPFTHPLLSDLAVVAEGYTAGSQLPETLHLDYLRTLPVLFPLGEMKEVPPIWGWVRQRSE